MTKVLIISGHPDQDSSLANRTILADLQDVPGLSIEQRRLDRLYPDFNIDVEAEQRAVEKADLVVLQHPMYWYSYPPLMKLWIDNVFTHGWAYGKHAHALKDKPLLWAVTTGGDEDHFGIGAHPGFSVLAQPLQATAIYCHMRWLEPVVFHGAYTADTTALHTHLEHYSARLTAGKED